MTTGMITATTIPTDAPPAGGNGKMSAPSPDLYSTGSIDLAMTGATYRVRQEAPLYLNVIREKDRCRAYPTDQGGGMRGGDTHAYRLSLTDGASLDWLPPAATLCYPSMHTGGGSCRITMNVSVGKSSRLVIINKPLIPCGESKVRQEVHLDVDETSSLFYLDILSAGRISHGEKWKFSSFINKLNFMFAGSESFIEDFELTPDRIPLSAAGFGEGAMYLTGIAYNDHALEHMETVRSVLNTRGMDLYTGMLFEKCYLFRTVDRDGVAVNHLGRRFI